MSRLFLGIVLWLAWTKSLIAFPVTFPDSPVVITELPPSITGLDRGVARTLVRDSRYYLYTIFSITESIEVYRSTDNGASWHPFGIPGGKLRWNDNGVYSPCIAIDQGDTLYAAWNRAYMDSIRGSVSAVYWNKHNGQSWATQETLTRDLQTTLWNIKPSLTVDINSKVHAVWTGGLDLYGSHTIAYTYLRPEGVWNWPIEDVGEHPNGTGDACVSSNLIGDGVGNLHLGYEYIWLDYYSFARYRKRWAGGTWGSIEDLSISPWDSTYSAPSITLIPGDTIPHATFTESAPYQPPGNHSRIFYRFGTDTLWSRPVELIPFREYSDTWNIVLSADRQGHLYTAWTYVQTYPANGRRAAENIWMREQEYPPFWREPFKVTNDTIIQGVYPTRLNDYPSLGYPVTENGVEITWLRTTYDTTTGQHYYLMYHRLPSLLGVEHEKEKDPPRKPEITLTPRPNPARGEMEITYGIQASSKQETVNLTIYNLVGERVRTLVHGPTPAGVYKVRWNGKDERLKEAPSGTYFFQLTVGSKQVIKKGTFIR